jgi:mRNA interferase HigB
LGDRPCRRDYDFWVRQLDFLAREPKMWSGNMRIIKEPTLKAYWLKFPDAEPSLAKWLDLARRAEWRNLQEVRCQFPSADGVTVASGNTVTVFNIGGNKYRLILSIKYRWAVIYVRDFLTHAQYDKDTWKLRH